MATWQPLEQGVVDICNLLREYLLPGVDQARIWQQLQRWNEFPDFNNYLAFILCQAEGQAVEVRQAAGLVLKNNLNFEKRFIKLDLSFQQYIKGQLLPCIGASDRQLRKTVGTLISTILSLGGLEAWPEILAAFVQCLDSNDYNHIEGALDALCKLCEDLPHELDVDVPGLRERPVNVFLPRLLQLFASTHTPLRKLALAAVNHLVVPLPRAMVSHMDTYLQGLILLSSDREPEVRKLVCGALVQLVEVHPDYLQSHMKNVISFMLQATQDTDDEVALEACEFWSAYCEGRLSAGLLRDVLPRLVEVLLCKMVYEDDDESVLEAEDDLNAPDRDQDLKPRFHKMRVHGGDGADDDQDDSEAISSWNLRKCSAAGLDILAVHLGDELLPILMPLIQTRLTNSTDPGWKEREAAVLAMGAVAEGCINGLLPSLAQIVSFLVPMLEDSRPLVRSITCWTLSRYSRWIVESVQTPDGQVQFDIVLTGLLKRILDPNKRVQEAACSAFATLEEEAADELPSRLEPILQHLMYAFDRYQRSNLRILYDAIGTLAECVGSELSQAKYLNILMPPLVRKWDQILDHDKDLFPLLECFTSIAQALGPEFMPYAEPVFGRCNTLIRLHLLAKAEPSRATIVYDKEFVVCSLDLLSGIAEGLGSNIEGLVARSDLLQLLLECCKDQDAHDVRQSGLALLGDLAKASINPLRPHLTEFLRVAMLQLKEDDCFTEEKVRVANNACWAIGEIAVQVRGEIAPYMEEMLKHVEPILGPSEARESRPPTALLENSAITIGRFGWACPEVVAPRLQYFLPQWCHALQSIRDGMEKEDAFRGLCVLVRLNPGGGAPHLVPICQAIGSWHEIHGQELRVDVGQVLLGYKQMLGETWEQCMAALDQSLRKKLADKYGV